jgi:hypothetical protein
MFRDEAGKSGAPVVYMIDRFMLMMVDLYHIMCK